jgi:hypothetical protein
MAKDTALTRGVVVILRDCLELSSKQDDELSDRAQKLLTSIRSGESEAALRMQVANIQLELAGFVDDGACKEAVERARKLVRENSN